MQPIKNSFPTLSAIAHIADTETTWTVGSVDTGGPVVGDIDNTVAYRQREPG